MRLPTRIAGSIVRFVACIVAFAIFGFLVDKLLHTHVDGAIEMVGVAASFFIVWFRKDEGELVLRESAVVLRRGKRVIADVPWSAVVWDTGYSSMSGRGGTYYYPTHHLTLGTVRLRLTGLANHIGPRNVKLGMGDMISAEDERMLRTFLTKYGPAVAPWRYT